MNVSAAEAADVGIPGKECSIPVVAAYAVPTRHHI